MVGTKVKIKKKKKNSSPMPTYKLFYKEQGTKLLCLLFMAAWFFRKQFCQKAMQAMWRKLVYVQADFPQNWYM